MKRLAVVDEYTRERLALKVDRDITSEVVVDTLSKLFAMRSVQRLIRGDYVPSSSLFRSALARSLAIKGLLA